MRALVRVGLLDVNTLIALLWKEHPFHEVCADWFQKSGRSGWATCPITEAGFARVLSSPAFTTRPPSVHSAVNVLKTATESSAHHHFWTDDLPIAVLAVKWKPPLGHKQVTDAYLLSLAEHHNGSLITFDQRIAHLADLAGMDRKAMTFLKP
jgi:toxin-antitoxin system PIN domain toxin